MKRGAAFVGLMLELQLLASCQSCPEPKVQVGDRIRVVIGAPEIPNAASCDALGFGVGTEFVAEIAERRPGFAPPDGGPWMQVCEGNRFTGPMSAASEWTFVSRQEGGASIWGGVFTARLEEACSGSFVVNVDQGETDSVTVRFIPEEGEACPEQCERRHLATIEILSGEDGSGGASGGGGGPGGSGGQGTSSGGSGSTGPSASGGTTGGVGGTSASGGASASGGSGGMPGLDPVLEQRMQALCDADCSNFEEVKQCRLTSGSDQQECWTNCYSAMTNTFYALCPDEFLVLLECAEAHPGAVDYSCEGTVLVSADSSCESATLAMRECVAERQGS